MGRGNKRLKKTIVAALLTVACLVVILLFAAPQLAMRPVNAPRQACIMNLRILTGAKDAWASDHNELSNSVPTWADIIGPANYLNEKPVCPSGGTYTLRRLDQKPTCTIADHTLP